MKKYLLPLICLLLTFIVTLPEIAFAAAGASDTVSWNVADVNGDGFLDLEFTAVNLIGGPIAGVQVGVSPEDAQVSIDEAPLLVETTDTAGKVLFKSMPGGSYVWRTSGIKNGDDIIRIDPTEFETTEEDLFLEWFLLAEWMPAETTDKGTILLESLADFLDYDLIQNPLPVISQGDDYNFRASQKYIEWLNGFEDYLDQRKGYIPMDIWTFTKRAVVIPKGVFGVAAQATLKDNYLSLLSLTRSGRWVGGDWVPFTQYTLNQHTILLDRGYLNGWFGIIYSVADLLMLAPEMDVLFDPSGDPAEQWTMVLQVGQDLSYLASSFVYTGVYSATLIGSLKDVGKVPTEKLLTFSKALGVIAVVIGIVLTITELYLKYKTWENFADNFWTFDVMMSLASICFSLVILAMMLHLIPTVGWIPIVGWVIAGVTILATLIYYLHDFFIGYWDKIEDYRTRLSSALTDLMDIRDILHSIDVDDLESSSQMLSRFALIASQLTPMASGNLRSDLLWANDYLTTLSDAQQSLANKVKAAKDALDILIGKYLWYQSSDGSKIVSGLAVGVNSTAARYLTPGSTDHFTFNASIWHPSVEDTSEFTFDMQTVSKSLDAYGTPRPSISSSEVNYGGVADIQGGWAWDVPATHDNHKDLFGDYDRFFAVSYTSDTAHVPPGGTEGEEFYFDGDSQDYTGFPSYFDPMIYADQSAVIPDPKTQQMRSYYTYKFYFDSDTTTDFRGQYDALDEWAEGVKNYLDSGIVQDKLEDVSNAIDYLNWASARKRMRVMGVDAVLVIDRSGSMSGGKIDSAKASAKQFVDLMQSNDMTGVVSYGSSAGVNYQLTAVTSSSVKLAAKSAINSIYASGNTAMGAGLRTAYNQLVARGDPSHAWAIVLMSNGWHNTGEHPYNVIPDLQAENIVVYTIGLGDGTDGVLLGNIASQTGGFYRFSPTFEELMGIYNDIASKVTGAQTISSTTGSVAQGETVQHPVNVDSSATQVTFTVGWSGSDIDLTLIRPDNQLVDPNVAAVDPNVEYVEEARYELYRISSPMPGTWTMIIAGISVPTVSEDFVAKATAITSVTFDLSTNKDSYVYPDPVKISVTLKDMGVGIKGANVLATVIKPDGEKPMIVLFDDGLSEHGDTILNDGTYTNFYRQFSDDGSYTISAVALGTTYTGEPFSRTSQKTVLVSGVPTDFTPPNTTLFVGLPQYTDSVGNLYVTSNTPFTLTAVDDNGAGSGVAYAAYRVFSFSHADYDTGWIIDPLPVSFELGDMDTGKYRIAFHSADNAGNVETVQVVTVFVDNPPPVTMMTMDEPTYVPPNCNTTYVTPSTVFYLEAIDLQSGLCNTSYRISNTTYDTGWLEYAGCFCLNWLTNGNYSLVYYSTDNVGNAEQTRTVMLTLVRAYDCLGDVNGDGKCNIFDVVLMVNCYQLTANDEGWNPILDLTNDAVINIFDFVTCISRYSY